jgi:hypothetical protein
VKGNESDYSLHDFGLDQAEKNNNEIKGEEEMDNEKISLPVEISVEGFEEASLSLSTTFNKLHEWDLR